MGESSFWWLVGILGKQRGKAKMAVSSMEDFPLLGSSSFLSFRVRLFVFTCCLIYIRELNFCRNFTNEINSTLRLVSHVEWQVN